MIISYNRSSLRDDVYVQGVSKKRYFLGFRLISVLEVGLCFLACVLESEILSPFHLTTQIIPLQNNQFPKNPKKHMREHDFYTSCVAGLYFRSSARVFCCCWRGGV